MHVIHLRICYHSWEKRKKYGISNFKEKSFKKKYHYRSSTCDNGASATFNEKEWKLEIDNLVTRGTKCNIYFREKEYAKDFILAGKEILTRDNFEIAIDYNTNGTIFEDKDDDGTTYYFAGNTTENYLQFGGFYWRIVRINGDNSIRIIYQGTSADSTGSAASIGHTDFNPITDNILKMSIFQEEEQEPQRHTMGLHIECIKSISQHLFVNIQKICIQQNFLSKGIKF